ncbi:MAG: type II toxin-antitoxin system HicA family toxin [Candidatus Woesearchaeota archaeon]
MSGKELLRILCNDFGFTLERIKGDHAFISKQDGERERTSVVALHTALALGTLKAILRQTNISRSEFLKRR